MSEVNRYSIGSIVLMHESRRRNGKYAGERAIVTGYSDEEKVILFVLGELRTFHDTQIDRVVYDPTVCTYTKDNKDTQ